MKKLLIILTLLFTVNFYSQMADTPCGYANCDEVEGEDKPASSIEGFFILFIGGILIGMICTKQTKTS